MERGRIQRLPKFFGHPLLSQERIKLWTSNLVGTFRGSIRTKAHENVEHSSREHSQGVPKIFRAPMYRAHCAVIFAIAQLSCSTMTSLCRHLSLTSIAQQEIVNWITTADGCVHAADATQLDS